MATATKTRYETVIGLEIHAELLTDSKIWCGCSTHFGAEPNTQCCPVCLGLPGTLPMLNERALEFTVKAGLALGCTIASKSWFDRKNYFYPDLAKAYQVSQNDEPFCRHGAVSFDLNGENKTVRINRVHLEEEAGKSLHSGDDIVSSDFTLLDYNRAGIPLIEIVTEPDIRSPEEARVFLEHLRTTLLYTGVSDCKMQEGSLRCDANISLRPVGDREFGQKAEIKNMNSFRAVQRALEYEVKRQEALLDAGESVASETRHWNEQQGITVSMRTKDEADDYRYFPDPDIVPVTVHQQQVDLWRSELPELPGPRSQRFQQDYGLSAYDAGVLTTSRPLADFFEEVARGVGDAKTAGNWVMGEVLRLLNEVGQEIDESALEPAALVELLALVGRGTISNNVGKDVFEEMFHTGKPAAQIVKEKGLEQISDESELDGIVDQVIADNPGPVDDVRAGKDKAIGFLVGQVMKATRGKANPQRVNEIFREKLRP